MNVYSILDREQKDIIDQCLELIKQDQIMQCKKTEVEEKCLGKVIPTLQYFINNDMYCDGYITKHLEENIIEFRIQLPRSDYLLRIIAWYTRWEMILLTWSLIKPKWYEDKKTTQDIDQEYITRITEAKNIRKDFTTQQQYSYSDISILIA